MATTKKLLTQFGDGATPENFAHSCTINTSQDFTIEATTTDATEPNCAAPDAPGWVLRSVDTLSASINGAGTMDPESFAKLRDKQLSGEPINTRVLLDLPKAKGGGWYAGRFIITSLGIAKEGKGYVSSTIALQSDGEVKWVAAAN
ncbi:phage tail tube protein [Agrobacterium larrymoorei]|uniref:Secreted protein n=1 Tax=Agrobacterium larrymoorei TaxID=160699 RepID=A0ABU0UF67_9HYPH|nr:phage tail tube protein [Agrobacterium larrymoorei]MDQ1183581.1 putative secreted protein [Agrobacterium larrymoorei]